MLNWTAEGSRLQVSCSERPLKVIRKAYRFFVSPSVSASEEQRDLPSQQISTGLQTTSCPSSILSAEIAGSSAPTTSTSSTSIA
jgi:hypothetical protein